MEQGKLRRGRGRARRAPASVSTCPTMRACSFSPTSGRACACSTAIWPAASRTCSLPVTNLRHSEVATRPLWPGARQAALALLQLGEQDEARRLAAEELELARTWGRPRALGAALRVAGLVEGGEQGLALLREAVEVLSGSPAKLEHAKARTELGAALRRANQRSGAREQLRRALELATICGARPLAARANTELRATGARPRRIALSGVESLTPSERRVAQMATEGPTNREIAQALFVTPRTVEVHLTSAYRKLGISSRSQLAAALAEPACT